MQITAAFIITIDSSDSTVDGIANWLQQKNIQPDLFCTQLMPAVTEVVIICEMDSCCVGLTSRRLRKLPGVTALECLLPKQYIVRPTPTAVSQVLQ